MQTEVPGTSSIASSDGEYTEKEGSTDNVSVVTEAAQKGSDNGSKDVDNSSEEAQTSESEEESMSVNPAEPLNMEEDDLSLENLIKQIGVPITDARKTLGIKKKSFEKSGVLFGETVKVTLKDSDESCGSIQLSFLGTPLDSLQNALSEQLGDDGTQLDDGILWTTEEAFVLLYESAEGCYVDIGLE